jgi:hypothetical protein
MDGWMDGRSVSRLKEKKKKKRKEKRSFADYRLDAKLIARWQRKRRKKDGIPGEMKCEITDDAPS